MKLCPSLLVALLLLVGGSSRSAAAPDKRDLSTNFLIERLEEFLREEDADDGDNAAASIEEIAESSTGSGDDTLSETRGGNNFLRENGDDGGDNAAASAEQDDPSAGSGDLEGSDETFFETRGGGVQVSRLSIQLPSQCAASTTNIAHGRPAEQSSVAHGGVPGRAVDGNGNRQWSGNSCTHTNNENQPWWRVDLGSSKCVDRVVVTNRQDCCSERLEGFKVYIGDNPNVAANPTCGGAQSVSGKMTISVDCGGRTGRYVGIALPGTQPLTLCEVQVFGGDSGYTQRGGTYYKVYAQLKTYEAAKQTCAADGGHLADVKTKALHDFLVSKIQQVDANKDYWVGLNDVTVENTWTWSDGTPVTRCDFTNWAPGEPNNAGSGQGQDCGQLWQARSFQWDDDTCGVQKYFICQIGPGEENSCQPPNAPGSGLSQCAASTTNIAQGRPAEQSSLAHGGAPGRAVDGNNNRQWSGNSCTHTNNENQPWWRVDLGSSKCVDRVVVTNRQDCCSERLEGFKVYIGDNPNVAANPTCGGAQSVSGKMTISVDCGGRTGRYVGIALPGRQYLTLCEVQVFGGAVSGPPAPLPPQCGPGQENSCEQPGEYISLGCWRDTGDRAIPTMEGSDPRLDGPYQNRQDAIRKCYNVAKDRGFSYFAVQNGGWCASSPIAGETYQKYGRSSTCGNDGEGGPWGNEVYKITDARLEIVSLGCWRDTADRAIPTMEGSDARLDGSYQARQDAINKCSKLAKARGFNFFAVQNGGWCASSATAGQTYRKYGPSTSCKTDGEGGPWGNQVYQITGSSACVAPLDLFLLLDGSGSVGTANFDKVKQFAADVVNSFDVSPTATRVGVAQYSDRNSLVFNLGDHADKPSTVSAINGISYQRGGTKTGAALEFVRQNAAWRGGAVPKVMIVLTDGKSGDAVAAPSQSLAGDGVAVYAIGVGNFDHAELLQIANSDQDKVIELTDFNALATKIDDIAKVVCSSVSDGCPSGYKSHSGICYKAFNTKKTFLQASKACYADGGTLAMPRDAATNAFTKSLKDDVDPSGFFWFGLVDQHQENEWVWIDGRPLGSFSDWKPGEPNNAGDEDFAEYFPTQWNDVGGNAKNRKFICQVIPIDCPEGYVYHPPSRMCYKAFDVKKNNEGAIEACSADGGSLAMPGDATTNVFLIYLKNAVDNKGWFRFGLTDEHEEGGWMRADGIALGNFQPWGPGEPNNRRNEDCAEYFPGSHPKNKRNKWNDGPCANQNRKFICQVVPKDCPKGYKQSGASCYKAFDKKKNHDEAAKICRAEGGSLAMPQDQATNDFLVNLKNEVDGTSWFWLGADDKNDEGTWQYADGEPFGSYRNWFPGEPNQAGGNEDCLMMFESPRNMWNDQGCATEQKFICQIQMPIVDSCGGNVPGEVGVIVSPGYPVTYTDHQKCSWNIMARPGKVITVIFEDFGLESTFDTVTVEDACSGKELGKFSGSTLPATVHSTDKQIRVIFTTDHSATERGFKLRYFASDPSGKREIAEPMPAQLPDEALPERDQEEPADNTKEGMLLETLKILEEDLRNAGNELE